jgi:hypothetical protein
VVDECGDNMSKRSYVSSYGIAPGARRTNRSITALDCELSRGRAVGQDLAQHVLDGHHVLADGGYRVLRQYANAMTIASLSAKWC